jgi:diphthine-ammonia ligase
VSLAYLWQSEQTPLLESMFSAGLEAVLVKVAGVGLGVDAVGQDLASMMPKFRRLVSTRFI